ncbi:hypothetical protein [Legionella septentrionalis]|uniref:hypothetical protein n=1 Tax=Legionella septentrionalis TaxID=2498109 RepID=UPI000F8E12AE|nr:hypothetical protein [Legionella septentrionalis]RUQ92917.1 hypothetical protein ELY11_12050 [Legionella septentrionalis]
MQKRSPKHRLIYLLINDDVLKALLGQKAVKTSPFVGFPAKRFAMELGNKMAYHKTYRFRQNCTGSSVVLVSDYQASIGNQGFFAIDIK